VKWLYTAERTNDWHNNTLYSWLDPTHKGHATLQLFCNKFIASVTVGVFEINRKRIALRTQSIPCYILAIHPIPRLKILPCNFGTNVQPQLYSSKSVRPLTPNYYHIILALTYSPCYFLTNYSPSPQKLPWKFGTNIQPLLYYGNSPRHNN